MIKKVLTIAGSDSGGGAGIQADIKTFCAHGVFGMSVITAVTAQNTQRVIAVQDISPDVIGKQIDAVFEDMGTDAVKIGMVSRIDSIRVIAERLRMYKPRNIILDPVMVSKSGYDLLDPGAVGTLIKELIPVADVITPNIPEAVKITGKSIDSIKDAEEAAKAIHVFGAKNVLVKGGHFSGESMDILYDGEDIYKFESERIYTKNTHGTGCTLSSAIASNLALGFAVKEAVERAKNYITIAIRNSVPVGKGAGPVNHLHELYNRAGISYIFNC
jgi:hydroxymethylpyrimidine/phosphomethylpyrimidine kinase